MTRCAVLRARAGWWIIATAPGVCRCWCGRYRRHLPGGGGTTAECQVAGRCGSSVSAGLVLGGTCLACHRRQRSVRSLVSSKRSRSAPGIRSTGCPRPTSSGRRPRSASVGRGCFAYRVGLFVVCKYRPASGDRDGRTGGLWRRASTAGGGTKWHASRPKKLACIPTDFRVRLIYVYGSVCDRTVPCFEAFFGYSRAIQEGHRDVAALV